MGCNGRTMYHSRQQETLGGHSQAGLVPPNAAVAASTR